MPLYPWHTDIYTQLTRAFLNGRGHHALLFKTETGVGTESLIRHFAHWLLCSEKSEAESCGQCKSCLLWASGNHPDFHVIEPIEEKEIGVDQIRDLITRLQQFSQQGGNAVIFLRGAERLTESAANALLKTLEEPNDKVYFLLEAPLNSPLLATIQSRCQTWFIHTPVRDLAFHWLQTELPTSHVDDLDTALRLCHNRPIFCKMFLETDRLQARKTFLQTFWRFFKSHDVWLLLSAFESDRQGVLQQLEWLDGFFADSLKAKLGIAHGWLHADLAKGILPFSQALHVRQLLAGQAVISETRQALQTINGVNQELILAEALTRLVLAVFEG